VTIVKTGAFAMPDVTDRPSPLSGADARILEDTVRAAVSRSGAEGWDLRDDGFWFWVRPAGYADRVQGWKLHISATPLSAPIVLLLPFAVAVAVDRVLSGRSATAAIVAVAALLGFGLAAEVAGGVASAACTGITTAWARRSLLRSVLTLGVAGRDRFATGDLISRLVGNSADTGQRPASIASVAVAVGTSAVAVVALWRIAPVLGAVFLAGLIPTIAAMRVFVRRMAGLFARYQQVQGQLSTRLTDALTGIRTIRAAGTADREIERILAPLDELSSTGRQTWAVQGSVIWRINLFAPAIEIVMLAVAGLEIAAGRIPTGDLLATAGYTTLALNFINYLDSLAEIARASAGARRVGEVCTAAAHRRLGGDRPVPPGPGQIELRDVTVRTDGDHAVLDRVSLTIAPGAAIALVGPSGSGKSTLARLIGRLTEPDEGTVLLDGVQIDQLEPTSLRREVAYAFERPALLGETVREAVTYAAADPTAEAAVHAAWLACADGFVRHLPQGYDTPLRGLELSGGEAQRLGLARALAQDARVLVLDDATSSLDTVTEMQISRTLTDALTGRTRLVIAKRAATAQRADLVAWLDQGRLRKVGQHEELWQDPDYRAVFAGSVDQ
jgi:ATP-binding cassette subfamily B protein